MNSPLAKISNRSVALAGSILITGAVLASFTGPNDPAIPVPATYFADTAKKDTTKFTAFKDLPLKPTRTISFTTSEGTWMSVDVSPDGNTILFDLMGDIYSIPATGGKA